MLYKRREKRAFAFSLLLMEHARLTSVFSSVRLFHAIRLPSIFEYILHVILRHTYGPASNINSRRAGKREQLSQSTIQQRRSGNIRKKHHCKQDLSPYSLNVLMDRVSSIFFRYFWDKVKLIGVFN